MVMEVVWSEMSGSCVGDEDRLGTRFEGLGFCLGTDLGVFVLLQSCRCSMKVWFIVKDA